MGQGQSRRRQQLQEEGQHQRLVQRPIGICHSSPGPIIRSSGRSSLFEFASLLFSGEARKFHQFPLPNCWDELLDWTIAATTLTEIIHIHQNEEKSHQQNHRHAIRFIPFVDSSMIDKVGKLPSMSWIERATFYAESVVVEVVKCTDDSKIETLHLITLIQLSHYYMLACRLTELLAVRQVDEKPRIQAEDNSCNECPICLECNLTRSILPCGHVMCELCENRCMRQKLACPFCRATFASAKQVRKDGWNIVTEWSTTESIVDSLDHDIAVLKCQMNKYSWMKDITTLAEPPRTKTTLSAADETATTSTISSTTADAIAFIDQAENALDGYIQLPRQFQAWIENDGFVFVE